MVCMLFASRKVMGRFQGPEGPGTSAASARYAPRRARGGAGVKNALNLLN